MGATVDLGTLRVGLETDAAAFAPAMQAAAAGLKDPERAAAGMAAGMERAAQSAVGGQQAIAGATGATGRTVKELFGRDPPGDLFRATQRIAGSFGAVGLAAGDAVKD